MCSVELRATSSAWLRQKGKGCWPACPCAYTFKLCRMSPCDDETLNCFTWIESACVAGSKNLRRHDIEPECPKVQIMLWYSYLYDTQTMPLHTNLQIWHNQPVQSFGHSFDCRASDAYHFNLLFSAALSCQQYLLLCSWSHCYNPMREHCVFLA